MCLLQTKRLGRFVSEQLAGNALGKAQRSLEGPRFAGSARHAESSLSPLASESDSSDSEEDLLPPVPRWGRRVTLAAPSSGARHRSQGETPQVV